MCRGSRVSAKHLTQFESDHRSGRSNTTNQRAIMYFGSRSELVDYSLNWEKNQKSEMHRGLLVQDSQMGNKKRVVRKVNEMLAFISRELYEKSKNIMLMVYEAILIHIWNTAGSISSVYAA